MTNLEYQCIIVICFLKRQFDLIYKAEMTIHLALLIARVMFLFIVSVTEKYNTGNFFSLASCKNLKKMKDNDLVTKTVETCGTLKQLITFLARYKSRGDVFAKLGNDQAITHDNLVEEAWSSERNTKEESSEDWNKWTVLTGLATIWSV